MKNISIVKTVEEANAITHGGVFHADEVFGTVILSKVRQQVKVLRTFKVPENLPEDIIVYDIGCGAFDHHQKDGNGARENGVPYAACGLLWKEFGPQIVADTANPNLVWQIVDKELIQGIDAVDNGAMPQVDYAAEAMTVSKMISQFNPEWNENVDADERFLEAVNFAETIFENMIKSATAKAEAQELVEAAIDKAERNIMIFDRYVPWQDFVFASENPKSAEILFAVYPSNRGGYNWQCVPDAPGSFGQRKPVPEAWKGLRDVALQEVTGVETAIFCHPAGFIGSAETVEDAIKMAKLAIEADEIRIEQLAQSVVEAYENL